MSVLSYELGDGDFNEHEYRYCGEGTVESQQNNLCETASQPHRANGAYTIPEFNIQGEDFVCPQFRDPIRARGSRGNDQVVDVLAGGMSALSVEDSTEHACRYGGVSNPACLVRSNMPSCRKWFCNSSHNTFGSGSHIVNHLASQSGYAVDYVTQGAQGRIPGNCINENSQAEYSRYSTGNDFMSQDYMAHGTQGLFTQVGYNDPSQDDRSQNDFGVETANALKSQVSFHTIMLAWKKPDLPVFKLNIDGTRSGVSGKIGAGGVLRNHLGDWIAGFQVNLGIGGILDAEAWGLFHGLKLA